MGIPVGTVDVGRDRKRITVPSSDFEAEPGEDEETNPRMYGHQVATWLHEQFLALGYEVECCSDGRGAISQVSVQEETGPATRIRENRC